MQILKNLISFPSSSSPKPRPTKHITFTETLPSPFSIPSPKLESLIKQITINTTRVTSLSHYHSLITTLLTRSSPFQCEQDFLLQTKHNKPSSTTLTPVQKYTTTGKIGNAPTYLDSTTQSQQGVLSFRNTRIESSDHFLSIRANNCVIKGKHVYECELLSNGLIQVGWCQLTTAFEYNEGVGDDSSSYAYDGYRNVLWHGKKKAYGKIWDKGDVIGCCIDMDKHEMSFYLNGEFLGTASDDVDVGENNAYFPACSLSKKEKCVFNFGQTPFMYAYQGYEPFDQLQCRIDNTQQALTVLLELIHQHILPILYTVGNDITFIEREILCYNVFDYVIRKGFDDVSALTHVVVPFLVKLHETAANTLYVLFWDTLMATLSHGDKKAFVNALMDDLTNLVYCYSLMGSKGETNWLKYVTLVTSLFTIESVVAVWMIKDSDNTWNSQVTHMQNIFHSNCIKHCDYYYQSLTLHPNIKHEATFTVHEMLRELDINQSDQRIATINHLDKLYADKLSNIIGIFLTRSNTYNEGKAILKDILNELLKCGCNNNINNINEFYNVLGLRMRKEKEDYNFFKNIFFNIIYYFVNNYISTPFELFTTELWFTRNDKSSLYYDEVGIGGTIAHVTNEYFVYIDNSLIVKNNLFQCEFLHKLIKLCYDVIISSSGLLKKLKEQRHINKKTPFNMLIDFEHEGCTKLADVIRDHFHLMALQTHKVFYLFSFYLVKYLNWLKSRNKYILYFVPTIVVDLPFELFKTLTIMKSRIFKDKTLRKEINGVCPFFSGDDYIQSVLKLYLYLFSDNTIANPDIREKLLDKVNFLIKHYYTFFEGDDDDTQLFTFLIDGIINDMQKDFISHKASKLFLKEILPCCFGYSSDTTTTTTTTVSSSKHKSFTLSIKEYFLKEKNKIFNGYINFYFPLLNKTITSFTIAVSEFAALNPLIQENAHTTSIRNQSLVNSYSASCDLLKILEFLCVLYPNDMLNVGELIGKNFMNVIKILSNRIYAEPYFTNLLKAVDAVNKDNKSKNVNVNLNELVLSTLGVFKVIKDSYGVSKYDTFVKAMANSDEVLFDSFMKVKYVLEKETTLKRYMKEFEVFWKFVEEIKGKRDKREYSDEEMNRLELEDKICVICRVNIVNVEMVPCKHNACKECIEMYLDMKDTCFICHQKVEKVQEIDVNGDVNGDVEMK